MQVVGYGQLPNIGLVGLSVPVGMRRRVLCWAAVADNSKVGEHDQLIAGEGPAQQVAQWNMLEYERVRGTVDLGH